MHRVDGRAWKGGIGEGALGEILRDGGYEAVGLGGGLGIGEYSETSTAYARSFAEARGAKLIEVDLRADHAFAVPTASAETQRPACSAPSPLHTSDPTTPHLPASHVGINKHTT
mgnify:CR=1 FL=1